MEPAKIPRAEAGFDINFWQKKYPETHIVFLGFARKMFSADAMAQLYQDCFKPRCYAAHPSGTVVSIEDVARMTRLVTYHLFDAGG